MRRRIAEREEVAIAVDRRSALPISEQIYRAISSNIVAGNLGAGVRLPSTRGLSQSLGVSRTTVAEAFDMLHADGLVESHTGSGTYVARAAARSRPRQRELPVSEIPAEPINNIPVSRAFECGLSLEYFPFDIWEELAAAQASRVKEFAREGDPAGYEPLRELLAEFSYRRRGIRCSPSQIIVTSGITQGLDLVARTLLRYGDAALIEDPCEQRVLNTLTLAGASLKPIPVDEEGMAVDRMGEQPFRLAHVSAVRQFPSGAPLSAERETVLREKAARHGAFLVEMENSFLVASPRLPLITTRGADHSRSIYLATFSWVLFRALRIGYIIVPEALTGELLATRFAVDFKPPLLEQVMLEQFMRGGHLDRYIDRFGDILSMRQAAMVAAWPNDLPEGFMLSPHPGGLGHLLYLPDHFPTEPLLQKAAAMGLALRDLSPWFASKRRRALQLGFAQAGTPTTVRGVEALSALLREQAASFRQPAGFSA